MAEVLDPQILDLQNQDEALQQAQRDESILKTLRAEFAEFKKQRESLMDPVWNECYKLYRSQISDSRQSGDWKSRIAVPYAFSNVEDVVPHLMEGIFGTDKAFKISSKLAPRLAEAHERAVLHQWSELIDIETKWEEVQRSKAIWGTGALYVGFKIEKTKRKLWREKRSELDPTLSELVIETEEFPSYIGNFVETIHIYNLYPHPRATIEKIKKLYWVSFRTYKELEIMGAGQYRNLERLLDKRMRHTPGAEDSLSFYQRDIFGEMNASFGSTEETEPEYRVVTCFDDINKKMYVMAGPEGGEVLLFDGDYPYFHNEVPIIFDRYLVAPKEFWGIGVIEPSISLIHEGNTIRNQRRDNVTMAMNGMLEVRENEIDDEEAELVSRPWGVVHSRSGNAVKPIQFPIVTNEAIQEEEIVRRDIRDQTGLGGALVGQTDPNTPSGTKFSLQQKGQLLRLSRAIKRQAQAIKKLVYQMVSNNAQFYPLQDVQNVLGPIMFTDWGEIQPKDIALHATITVKPVGLFANEDILRQQYVNFMNIFLNNPATMSKLDPEAVLRFGLKLFPDFPDPEVFLKNDNVHNDMLEHRIAWQENIEMAKGQRIPPADPSENKQIHLAHHYDLLRDRPDLFFVVGEHIQSHEVAEVQRQRMELQAQLGAISGRANGPSSAPVGQGGGLINPARMPSSTTDEGMHRQVARMQGRRGL